ncbi:MAG: helix-turn-helix transcriptional regulator [Pseudomonadota bacterium]
MTLADRIRARLTALNLSAHEAEQLGGLPKSFLSHLIDGVKKSVRAEQMPQIASVLGVSVDELLGEMDDPCSCHRVENVLRPDAVALLAPGIVDPAVYKADRPLPSLSVRPGDFLIADRDGTCAQGERCLFEPTQNGRPARRFMVGQRFGDLAYALDGSERQPSFVGHGSPFRYEATLRAIWRPITVS